MKILISAFEPFGEENVNASLEALRRLLAPQGCELIKIVLPTVFGEASELLLDALRREQPDAVIALGQAGGRKALTPERAAINCMDARIPDNAGRQPADEAILPGAPAAYFSTLPLKAMLEAAQRAGAEAAVSNSAGTFVCNEVMYRLLHAVSAEELPVRAGFVHVPCLPEQMPEASMPLEKIVAGLEAMLDEIEKRC
ncbi:MAG: pyroglutamyl-peptidase I [Oscillospiraceae bacterium]|nr:pyroglutamyl-peptidase I [Oscillospiraceae bacterium]